MNDFNQSLQDLRESYDREPLRRSHLSPDPFVQFEQWMQEAVDGGVYDPNACSLATVDQSGAPTARAVLLKGLENGKFVFYSNYNSRKAGHLLRNPKVSMHFPWFSMQRQVAVLGEVSKWRTHWRRNISSHAPCLAGLVHGHLSRVNRLIAGNPGKVLLKARNVRGASSPAPALGGYYLDPHSIEFWQGGPNRLHDRFLYQRSEELWKITRLNP